MALLLKKVLFDLDSLAAKVKNKLFRRSFCKAILSKDIDQVCLGGH